MWRGDRRSCNIRLLFLRFGLCPMIVSILIRLKGQDTWDYLLNAALCFRTYSLALGEWLPVLMFW